MLAASVITSTCIRLRITLLTTPQPPGPLPALSLLNSKVLMFLLVSVTVLPFAPGSLARSQLAIIYYVSPNGNDTNPGTRDLPFQTIQKARDSVRTVNLDM